MHGLLGEIKGRSTTTQEHLQAQFDTVLRAFVTKTSQATEGQPEVIRAEGESSTHKIVKLGFNLHAIDLSILDQIAGGRNPLSVSREEGDLMHYIEEFTGAWIDVSLLLGMGAIRTTASGNLELTALGKELLKLPRPLTEEAYYGAVTRALSEESD